MWGIQGLCGTEKSADSTAQQRMRTDDKTPQRPQATVVGDGRGRKGEKGGEMGRIQQSGAFKVENNHYKTTRFY